MQEDELAKTLPRFGRAPYPLVAVVFFAQIGLGMILFAVFQEYVPGHLGASDRWPGLLLAAYGLSRFFCETPTGAFSDRRERKLGMMIGFGLMVPAIIAMALVEDVVAFVPCAIALGIGTAFLWPTTYAIGADLYRAERRGQVVAIVNVGQLFGFGLGALIGAVLVERAPAFVFAFGGAAIALAFVSAVVGIPPYRTGRLWGQAARGPGQRRASLRSVMTPQLAVLCALILVANSGLTMIFPAIRPLGEEQLGVSFATLTVGLIPAVVLGALFYIPAGHITDRFGRVGPFFAGQILVVVGMFAIAETGSVFVASGAGAVIFLGNVLTVPAVNAAVMDLAPPSHRGALIGLTVALSGLGLALGPAAGGFIAEEASPAATFRVAAVVSAVTGLAVVLYGRAFAVKTAGQPDSLAALREPGA